GARRAGFEIVSMAKVPEAQRLTDFTLTWEEAFSEHWGNTPTSQAEFEEIFESAGPMGMYDASVLAYTGDEPVGVVWAMPDASMLATLAPGRQLAPSERVNFLGIGVLSQARGQGVNLALAAHCYLYLVGQGATHLSYTMVLDDNWPSRRTAEKLGAEVCANYVVYRRSLI
ncbi:MAG: GNAT family N-acetyltransferase, partial [Acidimicrobiales bacterium]